MSRLTRDGMAEPVSRDQILRHARGQGNINFPCSADHEQDWQPRLIYTLLYVMTIHIIDPPWEDQCEWHRRTRMTGPDCAVMCNLTNIHTYTGSSEVPRNPLTRWDVSSTPANGIFLTKILKNKNKNAQRVEKD